MPKENVLYIKKKLRLQPLWVFNSCNFIYIGCTNDYNLSSVVGDYFCQLLYKPVT